MLDEVIKQITKLLKDAAPSKKTLVLWGVRWLADQGLKAAGAKGSKIVVNHIGKNRDAVKNKLRQ